MKKQKADWEIAMEKANASLDKANTAIAELSKEVTRVNSAVNGIGDSNGIVAETFFEEATQKGITLKINEKDAFFEQTAINLVVNDEKLRTKAEIDIVMTNCDYLLLIETKYRLDEQNESVFDNKIRALKEYEPQAVEGKKILTAFASLGAKRSLRDYFTSRGHFVFTEKNRKIQMDYPVLQK